MNNIKREFIVWASSVAGMVLHNEKNLSIPPGWIFIKSGDPGLTRRIKSTGDYWLMVHRHRNRIESIGLWAPAAAVHQIQTTLTTERANPAYQKKLDASKRSREAKQQVYEVEFRDAVLAFLAFSPIWAEFAEKFADTVTAHAIPVGSGTVARTRLIPIARRAEAAAIAWMRHQTTAYDNMTIAKSKGERREVRRQLSELSRQLLSNYRTGKNIDIAKCPLAKALY